MTVLVCGGAGYIGSHAVLCLLEKGYDVVVIDNLEKGFRKAVSAQAELVVGDLRNKDFISGFFQTRRIDAVIDFAAYSLVGESVAEPLRYYENNVCGMINLLESMRCGGASHIVFSSTAAVYGEPKNLPIVETDPLCPESPYGETKLAVEKMLRWSEDAYGIKYTALRYFNVAGADQSGNIGEAHNPEAHLIPNILYAALGKEDRFLLYGDDYDTKDGTCVRDYIHVTDLVDAHVLALESMIQTNESSIYNLGNGTGFSNREILSTAEKVTGRKIPVSMEPRRPGDPSTSYASSEKITRALGWKPKYNSLETIIASAWNWHTKHPNGYEE